MKRKQITFLIITVAALCLAGCGKENGQSAGNELQAFTEETVQVMEETGEAETEMQTETQAPVWDAAEPDYLNMIEKRTGRLQEQIPLKSQPVYILRSDRVLYVRTYDTDYRFEIAGAAEEEGTAGDAEEPGQPMENYDGSYEKEVRLAGTKIRYRMIVADAALGSRFYRLLKSADDGISWRQVSQDPFDSHTGMGVDFTFLNEDFGFATLAHGGGDSAELWVTEDGGKSYQQVSMEQYAAAL